jgi:hypothetical protein
MKNMFILSTLVVMASGCSSLKKSMWECYGCLGSLQTDDRPSGMETGWQKAMLEKAEANDPEMAKKMKEAPSDPTDIWYTLDLHKAK